MTRRYLLIIIPLLISLFIYLFYRTEKTVVNTLFITLISNDKYVALRESVNTFLPLHKFIVYSLPEGLWVFCITLTSKSFYIQTRNFKINCIFIPLIFCLSLEILQLLHFANGRFDFLDIWISILFWVIAYYFFCRTPGKQNISGPMELKTFVCFGSYSIVYLAHVYN